MKTNSLLQVVTAVTMLASYARAGELIASSGKNHVQLVELFSSESCSSCPPADEYASGLKEKSGLWTRFVPVVFHVDYWNHLSWKDEFSSEEMTRRQQQIAATWDHPAVYTPGFMIDGKEWRGWRTSNVPRDERTSQIQLELHQEKDGSFEVKASGIAPKSGYTIRIAKLGMGLSTDVKDGENSGLHLKHDFLVLDWAAKSLTAKSASETLKFDALKGAVKSKSPQRLAYAVWIEFATSPLPLQAAGSFAK